MRSLFVATFLLLIVSGYTQTGLSNLSTLNNSIEKKTVHDWLINPIAQKAGEWKSQDGKDIILYNGLLKRVF
ncbi:MAG: hypothetical protein ACTHLE_02550, partial [Agriterribacter sp.]